MLVNTIHGVLDREQTAHSLVTLALESKADTPKQACLSCMPDTLKRTHTDHAYLSVLSVFTA